MKETGILGIDGDSIITKCARCKKLEQDDEVLFSITDIVVYKPGKDSSMLYGKFPPCSKCGTILFVVPQFGDAVSGHLRRIAIARAIDNGQLMEGTTGEDAIACRQLLKEFYMKKGDADLDAEFEGTVEVRKFVEGYESSQ